MSKLFKLEYYLSGNVFLLFFNKLLKTISDVNFFTYAALKKKPLVFYVRSHYLDILAFSGVTVALASMNPYFFWKPSHWLWASIFMSIYCLCVIVALYFYKDFFLNNFKNNYLSLFFGIGFLIYISLLTTLDGGHKKWFLIIPFFIGYILSPSNTQLKTFNILKEVYIILVLPAIIYQLLMLLGLDFNFTWLEPCEILKQKNGKVQYLHLPGCVYLNYTSYFKSSLESINLGTVRFPGHLPTSVVSRMCAVFSEPGFVGTISTLLLAAQNKHGGARNFFILLSGVLSLSLTFFILTPLLFILRRDIFSLIKLVMVSIIFYIILVLLGPKNFLIDNVYIRLPQLPAISSILTNEEKNITLENEILEIDLQTEVTEQPEITDKNGVKKRKKKRDRNSREDSNFLKLYNKVYVSLSVFLFGVAADASYYYDAQSYKVILTNYGAIGAALLFLFFASICCNQGILKNRFSIKLSFSFLLIFFLSFLQRPVIWLPEFLIIFIGALQNFKLSCKPK